MAEGPRRRRPASPTGMTEVGGSGDWAEGRGETSLAAGPVRAGRQDEGQNRYLTVAKARVPGWNRSANP